MGGQYIDSAAALLDVLALAAIEARDVQASLGIRNLVDLLRSRNERARAWAILGRVRARPEGSEADAGSTEADAFLAALQASNDYSDRYVEVADPSRRALLQTRLRAEGVAEGERILIGAAGTVQAEGRIVLDQVASPDLVAGVVTGSDISAEASALELAFSDTAPAYVDGLAEDSQTRFSVEVGGAVGLACDLAGSVLLVVDPSEVD